MLQDFNKFIYELNNIYIKELNFETSITYIENFYNNFIEKHKDLGNALLKKTAQIIIISTDDLLIQNSPIKNLWMKKTVENHIFHTNRGGEILNNIIQDVINKNITHHETIMILVTCMLLGVRSNLKNEFLNMYKTSRNLFICNIDKNIQKVSIRKKKKKTYKFIYITLFIFITGFLLTELHYFIRLKNYLKETNNIILNIRSMCGFQ